MAVSMGNSVTGSQAAGRPVTRGALRRDVIVQRALHIADAEGTGAVSFRRLAAEFAVTPMALYRHVRGRTDLIGAMADLLLAEISLPRPVELTADWVESLRGSLRSAAQVIADHPAASDLLRAGTGLSPTSLRLTEALLGILVGAGFSPPEALVIVQQLSSLLLPPRASRGGPPHRSADDETTGMTPERQGPVWLPLDAYPYLRATLPQAAAWVDEARDREFGVELLLAGVETLLARKAAGAQIISPHAEEDIRSDP